MNDEQRKNLRAKLKAAFPLIQTFSFRSRLDKQYLTVRFSAVGTRFTTGFDYLRLIREQIQTELGRSVSITSGGPDGGTIRLNPVAARG